MLTVPWDEAREKWKDKRIIIQAEGTEFRAWQGIIRDSYYEPILSDAMKPYPHALRIFYEDVRFTDTFPHSKKPFEEWTPCGRGPRLILETRYLDLSVTDNDQSENKGGDLWCMFEISEGYQRPSGPKCTRGWFIVKLGKHGSNALELAKQNENMRALRF